MKPDKQLQLEILKAFRDVYPAVLVTYKIKAYKENEHFMANIFYLEEHNLLEGVARRNTVPPEIVTAKITAEGLDFLENISQNSDNTRTPNAKIELEKNITETKPTLQSFKKKENKSNSHWYQKPHGIVILMVISGLIIYAIKLFITHFFINQS